MTIDNHKIVPKSARLYPAIGGGWGVKMRLSGGGELLFGGYADKATAEQIVARANRQTHNTTVAAIERGTQEQSMPNKGMIEVRVMLTAEEARAISREMSRLSSCINEPKRRGEGALEEYRMSRDPLTRNAFEKMCRAIGGQRPVEPMKFKLISAA